MKSSLKSFLGAVLAASRPKTLTAAAVPIIVATALAYAEGGTLRWWIPVFALLSASLIQIGTNFVNDALDFKKGADTGTRLGEARATQAGWLTPKTVMGIGLGCFAGALVLGIPLVMEGGWPIVVIGLISLVMGYAYTGGPLPLAYVGLGDLFVVIFFGLVAVGGVYYLDLHTYSWAAAVAGLQIGLLATVLIAINNLRDLDQDRLVGKKTLAVRLGPRLGRIEVALLVGVAYILGLYWLVNGRIWAFLLPTVALIPAIKVLLVLFRTPAGRHYNQLLARAAFVHMLFGVLLSLGLIYG